MQQYGKGKVQIITCLPCVRDCVGETTVLELSNT